MDGLDRTMTLAMLTMVCLIGIGVSDLAKLDTALAASSLGFVIFGIAALASAFYVGGEEEKDDTEDSETPE